jgi:hypothetical protein
MRFKKGELTKESLDLILKDLSMILPQDKDGLYYANLIIDNLKDIWGLNKDKYSVTYFTKKRKKELKELIDKDLLMGLVDNEDNVTILYFSKLKSHRLYQLLDKVDDIKNKRTDRLNELEQLAYNNLTGEQIENELSDIDPKLKKEYQDLMNSYGD